MSNKDIDNLFKDSFENHQEQVNISDWNDYLAMEDKWMDDKRVTQTNTFRVYKRLFLSFLILLSLGIFIWIKTPFAIYDTKQINDNKKPKQRIETGRKIEDVAPVTENKIIATSSGSESKLEQAQNLNKIENETKVNNRLADITSDQTNNIIASTIPDKNTKSNTSYRKTNKLFDKKNNDIIRSFPLESTSIQLEAPEAIEISKAQNKNNKPANPKNSTNKDIASVQSIATLTLTHLVSTKENDKIESKAPTSSNIEINKPTSKYQFYLGLSFDIYPYRNFDDRVLAYNLRFGIQKKVLPKVQIGASLFYTFRKGNYNFTQQESSIQLRFSREQTNYAIIPIGVNLAGLSFHSNYQIKESSIVFGAEVGYLINAVGRLHSTSGYGSNFTTEDFEDVGSVSNIGIIDKDGLDQWRSKVFLGFELPILQDLSFRAKINYVLKDIAQRNNANESILLENNPFFTELEFVYKF